MTIAQQLTVCLGSGSSPHAVAASEHVTVTTPDGQVFRLSVDGNALLVRSDEPLTIAPHTQRVVRITAPLPR